MTYFLLLCLFLWVLALSNKVSALETKLRSHKEVKPEQETTPTPPLMEQYPHPQAVFNAPIHRETKPVVAVSETSANLEYKFGGNVLTAVGGVALLIGAGFFLQFAVQAGWLNESARVLLGIVTGAVLLGIGAFLKKKYTNYAYVVAGTGIGVWYLTVFASFAFYSFISQGTAYILAGLVGLVAALLAVWWEALPLAIFATLGALLTPALFGLSGGLFPQYTFSYLLVADFAILAIAYFRLWSQLSIVSFLGTILWYSVWFSGSYSSIVWAEALWFASIYFLLYFLVSFLHVANSVKEKDEDALLPILNALQFLYVGYTILFPFYPQGVALFVFCLGLVHVIFGNIFGFSNEKTSFFRHYMSGIGLLAIVLSVPIYFHAFVVVILWALMALLLSALGFYVSSYPLRLFANGLYVVTLARLFLVDYFSLSAQNAFFNQRFSTLLFIAVALLVTTALYWLKREVTQKDRDAKRYVPFVVAATFVVVVAFAGEIGDFFSWYWIAVVFSLASLKLTYFSDLFESKGLRIMGLLSYIGTFVFLAVAPFGALTPIFNERVFVFLMFAAATLGGMLLLNKKQQAPESGLGQVGFLALLCNLSMLMLITQEIQSYVTVESAQRVALSVGWLLYALFLLGLGIVRRLPFARQFSIGLCALVIIKVFLYDALILSTFFRFVSFGTLGVILLLVGFLYNKYKTEITAFVKG